MRKLKTIFVICFLAIFSACSTSTNMEDTSSASSVLSTDLVRSAKVSLKGNGEDTVTIMVYMNGSDLESEDGAATADLMEMVAAGESDKVNVVVQTMGTKKWKSTFGIASNRSQRYEVNKDGLTLVEDDLGQLDSTSSSTLSDFITWTTNNYEANRYILILWDHGGGPVYGFGYDQYQDEDATLTLDEIQSAVKNAGTYFDFIGMDCCIMSSLEVCCALYDYCDYMVLSEDFEPGIGWYYTDWLKKLYENSSVSTTELGTSICDSGVKATESEGDGENTILALLDESMMKVLYASWTSFAYANEDSLLNQNYSQKMESNDSSRILPILKEIGFFSDWSEDDVTLEDYYITDIMSVAQNIDSDESSALSQALSEAIVYMNSTSGESSLTGLSVTLPYGDSDFYSELKTVFTNCGIDSDYITWLKKFVSSSNSNDFYDYDDWNDDWSGWDDFEGDYDWDDWEDDYYDDDQFDDFGWDDWHGGPHEDW